MYVTVVYSMAAKLPVKYGCSLPRKATVLQLKAHVTEETKLSRMPILIEVREDGRLFAVKDDDPIWLQNTSEDSLFALEVPELCFSDISFPSAIIADQSVVLATAVLIAVSNVEVLDKEQRRYICSYFL